MQPHFDFDHLCHLAQHDPAAFEAQRHALFEAALAEVPPAQQGAARAALAQVQVRMAAAPDAAARLAAAVSALSDTVAQLQHNLGALCGEMASRGRPLATAR